MNFKKRVSTLLAILMIVMLTFVGCGNSGNDTAKDAGKTDVKKEEVLLKDRAGNEFKRPKEIKTIISTAPSNTEVLVDLGLGDKLVAIDKYSKDIEGLKEGITQIDFRNPDAETIVGLKPDIIIASGHNIVGDKDPFKAIKEAGITVVYIPSSDSIDGIYKDIEFMAEVTGTEAKGKEIIENTKKEIEKIKAVGDKITDKKKVYFEIGSGNSLYSFGKSTFLNEMIEIVGAKNIFADQEAWISPSAEAVVSANPDVILTNEGYVENATEAIKKREGWKDIKAIKDNQVYLIDNNSSSRPSQNIIKALKEMAKAIYPDKYEK